MSRATRSDLFWLSLFRPCSCDVSVPRKKRKKLIFIDETLCAVQHDVVVFQNGKGLLSLSLSLAKELRIRPGEQSYTQHTTHRKHTTQTSKHIEIRPLP